MTPELRLVLNQAKQLKHTEQLELITHLVNHAMPIAAASVDVVVGELVDTPPAPPSAPENVDPQCEEFLDELNQYQHTQQFP